MKKPKRLHYAIVDGFAKSSAAVTIALALYASNASAATILVSYDFSSNASATTVGANNTATAVSGSGFGNSNRSSSGNFFGQAPSVADGNSYIQFTLTATSGTLNLGELTFNYGAQGDNNADFTATFAVRTSVDGYAADVATTYSLNPMPDQGDFATTPQSANADLTGAAYQGLSTITFRLYGETDGPSVTNNEILRWDNIEVTAVPEPSTALLGSLGLLVILRRRR